jgi:hypothetical protein
MSGGDEAVNVPYLYARLAAGRAVDASTALRRSGSTEELLGQGAQALEDAAGTLHLASEMYRDKREGDFARVLLEQARALVVLAAQFEQAADVAREDRRREQGNGHR